MISRDTQLASPEEYYSDSLMMKPSTSKSVYDNLAASFSTPKVLFEMVKNHLNENPESQAIISAYQAVSVENETPGMGWAQRRANDVAGIGGMLLNPLSWVGGEAGGLVARGAIAGSERVLPSAATVFMRRPIKELLGEKIGSYIPAMVGKEGAEKTLSFGLISENAAKNFAIGAGAGLPQAIADNYNIDQDHILWGGVAREAGEMGAFGMAIGSIPFAYGVLRGKINRSIGRDASEEVGQNELNHALTHSVLSDDEHAWYQNYLENQKNPDAKKTNELESRASNIIHNNGYAVDTIANEARFDILKPEDIRNLHGGIADQLAALMPDETKMALTDFMVHNRFDELRQDPQVLDGVRGYLDFINGKLQAKQRKLLQADAIVNDHLMTGLKDNLHFSQKDLFKTMRKVGFESSHIQQLPVTIPENLTKRMRMQEKINNLKTKVKKEKRKGLEPNKQTLKRIEELENNLPKLLTPKEELEHLWNKILSEKGLSPRFQRSEEYHRLLDLSEVWHNARTLLDRVHLEHEYNRQEAFRDLSQHVVDVVDSDASRISNPDNVIDYLKNRIEGKISTVPKIEDVKKEVKTQQHVPVNADEILHEQSEQIKHTEAKDARNEFDHSMVKVAEFKQSPNVFKNLIACVLGKLNG